MKLNHAANIKNLNALEHDDSKTRCTILDILKKGHSLETSKKVFSLFSGSWITLLFLAKQSSCPRGRGFATDFLPGCVAFSRVFYPRPREFVAIVKSPGVCRGGDGHAWI
jgi:hypothetical protein